MKETCPFCKRKLGMYNSGSLNGRQKKPARFIEHVNRDGVKCEGSYRSLSDCSAATELPRKSDSPITE